MKRLKARHHLTMSSVLGEGAATTKLLLLALAAMSLPPPFFARSGSLGVLIARLLSICRRRPADNRRSEKRRWPSADDDGHCGDRSLGCVLPSPVALFPSRGW